MPRSQFTFDNIDNKVPDISDGSNLPTFDEEFTLGAKLYSDRLRIRRQIKSKIKPLYLDALKRKQDILKRPFYKLQCTYAKEPPFEEYEEKHVGNFIFDREILSNKEHIDLLSKPRRDYQRHVKKVQCNYVKRYFPNCTTRIDVLASPKKLKIEGNFNDYAHLYNARQRLNMSNYLIKSQIKFTSIETALTFIKEEEKMKKRGDGRTERQLRVVQKEISKSRRKYVEKIVMAIWEVMKEFLTSPCPGGAADTSALEKVINQQIMRHIEGSAQTSNFKKTINNLSANLALWMYSFIQTCGFGDIFNPPVYHIDDSQLNAEEEEFKKSIIPVDDFIPVDESSSSSGIIDEECCIEEDANAGEQPPPQEEQPTEEPPEGQENPPPEGENPPPEGTPPPEGEAQQPEEPKPEE